MKIAFALCRRGVLAGHSNQDLFSRLLDFGVYLQGGRLFEARRIVGIEADAQGIKLSACGTVWALFVSEAY